MLVKTVSRTLRCTFTTLSRLFRGKVDYPTSVATESVLSLCFVYDKQHFHLEVKWAIPHFTFFFCLFIIFIHISHVFSRKINNLHGGKLLSGILLPFVGTFRIFSAHIFCQNLISLLEVK